MGKGKMLEYQRVLNSKRDASDPWNELANAIVEQAAEDYRSLMTKKITRGLSMSDLELKILESRVLEIKLFFESDYGGLLAHGLNLVIWEKLQKEFADQNAEVNIKIAEKRKREAAEKSRKEAAKHE